MKLSLIFCCAVMMSVIVPITAMDRPDQQKHQMVKFLCKDGGSVAIKKSHLPLIKTLDSLYRSCKQNKSIELFSYVHQHISAQGLAVVGEALNVIENAGTGFENNKESYMIGCLESAFRCDYISDQFKKYYTGLSIENRDLLIKLSGQYGVVEKGDETVTVPMLNIPEITRHLIEVCYLDNNFRHMLKSYFNDDRGVVRNYFKERLIKAKRPLLPLQELIVGPPSKFVAKEIHPQSLFINGYCTNHSAEYPIQLFIGDESYKTYGYSFITDDYECRVTESIENQPSDQSKKQYCLWALNHKNDSSECLATIEHLYPIKGVHFSKTKTNVEYVVTYSDHDMIFSQILIDEEGLSFVESVSVLSPNAGTIVGMCFNYDCPNGPFMRVGTHEGVNSVSRYWDMHGKLGVEIRFPFKDFGALDQIFASKRDYDNVHQLVFSSGKQYDLFRYDKLYNQPGGTYSYSTGLGRASGLNNSRRIFAKLGRSCFVSDSESSPFAVMVQADKKRIESSFFARIVDEVCLNPHPDPDNESFKVYSPDGTMLLSNMLKKKLGILYVETTLKDAVTHIPIISIDTSYSDFVGVGFSRNSTKLILLNYNPLIFRNNMVSLLDDVDKAMLKEAEGVMFNNVGTVALVKRLCMECKKNGIVQLVKDSQDHRALMGWSKKSTVMLEFLKKCLPIEVIKAPLEVGTLQ